MDGLRDSTSERRSVWVVSSGRIIAQKHLRKSSESRSIHRANGRGGYKKAQFPRHVRVPGGCRLEEVDDLSQSCCGWYIHGPPHGLIVNKH